MIPSAEKPDEALKGEDYSPRGKGFGPIETGAVLLLREHKVVWLPLH